MKLENILKKTAKTGVLLTALVMPACPSCNYNSNNSNPNNPVIQYSSNKELAKLQKELDSDGMRYSSLSKNQRKRFEDDIYSKFTQEEKNLIDESYSKTSRLSKEEQDEFEKINLVEFEKIKEKLPWIDFNNLKPSDKRMIIGIDNSLKHIKIDNVFP